MLQIEFDSIVFQEGKVYIAYSPKLDVSSCGSTVEEAGYESKDTGHWTAPRVVATEFVQLQAQ